MGKLEQASERFEEILDRLLDGRAPTRDDEASDDPLIQKLVRLARERLGEGRVFPYLATMNHELRTPLSAIIGYSEIILDELDHYEPEALRADVGRIHHAGRHLLGLIEEVVEVARLESGTTQLSRSTLEMGSFLKASLPTHAAMIAQRDNVLEWEIEAGLRVRTDGSKVRSILRMLLQRAARLTSKGRIQLKVLQQGEEVWIQVSDTGRPLSPEEFSQTFKTFETGQTGGLSTAFRLAQLLGGRLTAASTADGNTFSLCLPALDLVSDEAIPVPVFSSEDQVVLVIDDDPVSHDLISRHLHKDEYKVISAYSGPEALRIVEVITPNVIALEAVLPDMDGWEVLSRLKSKPNLANVPIVMMSMLPDVGGKAVGLGADGFVSKPFDRTLLLNEVTELVGPQRKRILVIDDEADARELVRRTLLPAGHLVDEVPDGASALAYLQRARPDLILLDLMMPEMDGFDVMRELQGDPEWAQIPLVVLTGMQLSDTDRRRLSSAQVVQKGVGRQAVLEGIDAALVKSRTPSSVPRSRTPA